MARVIAGCVVVDFGDDGMRGGRAGKRGCKHRRKRVMAAPRGAPVEIGGNDCAQDSGSACRDARQCRLLVRCLPLLRLLACLLLSAPPAAAALRSPQVPVAGTALANVLRVAGPGHQPTATDQQNLQQMSVAPGTSFRLHAPRDQPGRVGERWRHTTRCPLAAALPWPGGRSQRTAGSAMQLVPDRSRAALVVNLFDPAERAPACAEHVPGCRPDRLRLRPGAAGAVYLQDARNPLGAARIRHTAARARTGRHVVRH